MQLCNAAGYMGPHQKECYKKNKPPKVFNCSVSRTAMDDEGGPAAAGEQGTYWSGRRSVGQGATCRVQFRS
eukprot:scaffold136903_cov184-Phaeocystis_antarctica.AAC.1